MSQPTVAILGASNDRNKYGNKSVRAHQQQGYQVFPVNPNEAQVEGLTCYPSLAEVPVEKLDRISVYLPPQITRTVLTAIHQVGAREVWFNPGSANAEVLMEAIKLGIEPIQACSIVAVGASPSQL